jgi:hypothetical protein
LPSLACQNYPTLGGVRDLSYLLHVRDDPRLWAGLPCHAASGPGGPHLLWRGLQLPQIAGTNYWSQHAWGNALDLFPTNSKYNDEIARAAVTQATKRTFANRGRKLDLSNVIDHLNGRIWTPGTGWHEYNGTVGPHVHVQAAPIKTGTPACA